MDLAPLVPEKGLTQLQREEAGRFALESAACRIESQAYESEAYQKALKVAARLVRDLKP